MDNQAEDKVTPEVIDVPPMPVVEKEKHSQKSRWFWPFILIFVGIILLIQNISPLPVHLNWWAAFIYIPVLGSIAGGISAFQKSGKFDATVRNSLGGVFMIGTVATLLLLGADWGDWWPLMVIATGFSMLLNGLSFADAAEHPSAARWSGLGLWFGLGTILLGVGFLGKTLPIPMIADLLKSYPRWWAIPILVPGVGAFISALVVCIQNQLRPNWTVWGFSIIGICFTATGLFALLLLNWNLLGPIILIASGVVVLASILIKK